MIVNLKMIIFFTKKNRPFRERINETSGFGKEPVFSRPLKAYVIVPVAAVLSTER